jgi:hypothetical protein
LRGNLSGPASKPLMLFRVFCYKLQEEAKRNENKRMVVDTIIMYYYLL